MMNEYEHLLVMAVLVPITEVIILVIATKLIQLDLSKIRKQY